jgi:hypothetical protein
MQSSKLTNRRPNELTVVTKAAVAAARRASYSLFAKHKSAPLTNQLNSSQMDNESVSNMQAPLNDISNKMNAQLNYKINIATNHTQLAATVAVSHQQQRESDQLSDLENFFFSASDSGSETVPKRAKNNIKTHHDAYSLHGEENTDPADRSLKFDCKQNSNESGTNHENSSDEDELCMLGYHEHTQQTIKQSLDVDAFHRNLIGDRSKEHVLPVIKSNKHTDLYCISSDTLADVLDGKYSNQIDECIIIDSRYPYEYEGGHISCALNIYTKEKLFEEMFIKRLSKTLMQWATNNCRHNRPHSSMHVSYSTNCIPKMAAADPILNGHHNYHHHHHARSSQSESESCSGVDSMDHSDLNQTQTRRSIDINSNETSKTPFLFSSCSPMSNTSTAATFSSSKRGVIIIFHCEFSSARGPSLLRFLRNQDRSLNEHVYPSLFYPELYLLEGGYKSFYERFKVPN